MILFSTTKRPISSPDEKIVEAFFLNFFHIIGTVGVFVYMKYKDLTEEPAYFPNQEVFTSFGIIFAIGIVIS